MIHFMRLLVGAGLGTVIVLVLANPHAMLSPGAMSAGHEAKRQNCLACHVPGRGVPVAKCVACHPVERIGLETSAGEPIVRTGSALAGSFHAKLSARNCLACHGEHQGPDGGRAGRGFSHELLDAATRTACATCHRPPDDALHRGAGTACATCHANTHWKPATFEHERYFPLRGEHEANCNACHDGGTFERYSCYGCHEHARDRVLREHAEEGIVNLDDCVRCHRDGSREGSEHEGRGREGGEGGRRRGDRRERGGDDD